MLSTKLHVDQCGYADVDVRFGLMRFNRSCGKALATCVRVKVDEEWDQRFRDSPSWGELVQYV